jgi:membrane protease YdiL (CAAX protease family)
MLRSPHAARWPARVSDEHEATSPPGDAERKTRLLVGFLALVVVVLVGGGLLGGEARQFAAIGATYAPFILLAGLLQLRRRAAWVDVVAWIGFWLLLAGVALVTLGLVGAVLLPDVGASVPPEARARLPPAAGALLLCLALAVALVASGRWLVVGCWLGARLDPSRPDHAQGLVGLLCFCGIALVPLLALGGEPPLLRLIARDPAAFTATRGSAGQLADEVYGLLWMLPFALLGVGLPLRRGLRQALARLGIRPLPRRQYPLLLVATIALVALSFALDALTALIWGWLGWPRTNAEAVNRLFGAAISPVGAVTTGVTAGVGEELVARGLLQPRCGWLLPNLAFAASHAYQYGLDGVLAVFVIGAALAAVRARWSTSASMLVHGLYDFTLFFGSAIGLPGF